ncbi:MAG: SDR family oxidoreductase [Flavobacteriales bacterium]|nr:SDR family oxidoreductase [Flavobacteriales bacterium]
MSKVVLVTGGAQGIGRAICTRLVAGGWTVFGTSRQREGVTEGGYTLVRMDVTDEDSVRRAVEEVVARAGRLDAVVNNAGVGIMGAVEDISPELAQRHFNVNVSGPHRVVRASLPHLRAAGGGHVVMISSLAANFGLPFRGFYSAGKAALERMSEALALEVRPFGIEVVVVEPGDVRTSIAEGRAMPGSISAHYQARYDATLAQADRSVAKARGPEAVAALVERILNDPRPAPLHIAAKGIPRWSVWIKQLLPGRIFQRLLAKEQG